MLDPNGTIVARSASLLAPDSVAAIPSPPGLVFFAIALQSQVHNAVRKNCVGPHFVLHWDRKRCLLKTAFPVNVCACACVCVGALVILHVIILKGFTYT